MKYINAVWMAFLKMFEWRQIGPEDVLEILASYRYNIGSEGVSVKWNKGGRVVSSWIPRRCIRLDTTGRVGTNKTFVEVRGNSCRLTMGRGRYNDYLDSWYQLRQKWCQPSRNC